MLILLFALAGEAVGEALGLLASPTYLHVLANIYGLLALVTHPLALLPSLFGAPLVALRKGRSFWRWLLVAIAVGPFAFFVALLPKPPPQEPVGVDAGLSCGACGFGYATEDYRADAESWKCSRCGADLPRSSAA